MDARERYDEICDDLAAQNPEVVLTQMMGMPAMKADGKLVCGFIRSHGAMVFKLPDASAHAEAPGLEARTTHSLKGRPFPPGSKRCAPSSAKRLGMGARVRKLEHHRALRRTYPQTSFPSAFTAGMPIIWVSTTSGLRAARSSQISSYRSRASIYWDRTQPAKPASGP